MASSRSIPHELWVDARQRLIAYFSRRGLTNAEDLAQETLFTLWQRDYPCDKEEDFPKICYGFARNIMQAALREAGHGIEEFSEENPPASMEQRKHFSDAETLLLLKEIEQIAASKLAPDEWAAIQQAMSRGKDAPPMPGRLRVLLYRARQKLAHVAGWSRMERNE
jgi:DNA-directed RNA polymerase specialized sigma24 family protein